MLLGPHGRHRPRPDGRELLRRRPLLSSVLAALALAGEPAARQEGSIRKLDRVEVAALADDLERFNSPCKYLVEGTEIWLERDAAVLQGEAGAALREAARHGADGTAARRRTELEEAFDRVAVELPAGETRRTFTARVAFTPELQVESAGRSWTARSSGQVKCLGFNLIYDNYEGSEHYLQIWPPSPSPVLYDPRRLLQPLQLDPHGLQWWREYEWEELETGDPALRTLRLHPGDPARHFRIELDAGTGLPLAASYRHAPEAPEVQNLAIFGYAPARQGSSQSWLRSVLDVTFGQQVVLGRYTLAELDFDVGPDDLRLEILAGTTLFDERGPERKHHGSGPAAWPREVESLVTLRPRDVAPAQELEVSRRALISRYLRWTGIALVFLGGALLFRRNRRKEPRA